MKTPLLILAAVFLIGSQTTTVEQPTPQAASIQPISQPVPVVETVHGKVIVETFQAKAIRAVDGDTLEILKADKTTPNCRLESIDTPETGSKNVPGQPFARNATEELKRLVIGKSVTVHQTGVDGFKRPLVFVVVDGVNVNAELVKLGVA